MNFFQPYIRNKRTFTLHNMQYNMIKESKNRQQIKNLSWLMGKSHLARNIDWIFRLILQGRHMPPVYYNTIFEPLLIYVPLLHKLYILTHMHCAITTYRQARCARISNLVLVIILFKIFTLFLFNLISSILKSSKIFKSPCYVHVWHYEKE